MGRQREGEWPEHVAMFRWLETCCTESAGEQYRQVCWRSFNSHWYDDRRTHGDVARIMGEITAIVFVEIAPPSCIVISFWQAISEISNMALQET